jgi:hypothetical protein
MSVAGRGADGVGSSGAPATESGADPRQASLYTLWSWLMLPGFLVLGSVAGIIGQMLAAVAGLHTDKALSAGGATGWIILLVVLLIAVLPMIGGVLLARRAIAAGGGGGSKAALVVNAALGILVLTLAVVGQIMA